ncbi:PHB depolymerase family esterase [Rhodobacteraceae bacterium KMM 6894]|nr:PHB depolymerase family esterase [Rhodobacteraceae bacterium KMM 6894]
MKNDFNMAMRQATDLVRAGDLNAATQQIQSALAGAGEQGPTVPKHSAAAQGKPRGLRQTLADLALRMPSNGTPPFGGNDPSVPKGARFDSGSFTCHAGSREYRVYVPKPMTSQPSGMIMMLHGCTQSPVDFANGTGMNQMADKHGVIVVYPAQSRGANLQSCWNWFSPTDQDRDAGEPAILAGLAEQLCREYSVPQGKTFVAGLSAGAAMAVILGRTYSDSFAAVGAHSGLPYKAAHDMSSAFAAMGGAPAPTSAYPVPTIVFHGQADNTVKAVNGQRIADDARPKGPEVLDEGMTGGRRHDRATVLSDQGHPVLEHWRVDGLGHAWSGGNAAGSYADPAGPDASAEMVRFFLDLPVKGE